MSLDFLYGTADKHHQAALIQKIAEATRHAPEDQFFLIVPNHIKFESEVNLMTQLQKSQKEFYYASTNIQTFSFSRLAWFFLKDTQFYQKNRLDSAAQSMILTKIFQTVGEKLKVFRGELRQPGFVAAIAAQLTELQNEQISPQQLQTVATQLQPDSDTALKLQDLQLIYAAYLEESQQGFITNDQLLNALRLKLAQLDLQHTHFYLHGFNQLTAAERNVVTTMIAQAKKVTITLVLDQPSTGQPIEKNDLFFRPKRLQQQLIEFAAPLKIPIHHEPVTIQRVAPDLKAVGDYWYRNQGKSTTCPALHLTLADTPSQEIEAVALKIHSLVVDEGYHYHDFLVLAKHLSEYETVVKPTFDQFQIPYFNDLQIPMQDHPLLAFLTALFDVSRYHYRYEAIMRLLRTELLVGAIPQDQFRTFLDITDNYLLAHNLYQKDWASTESWHYEVKHFSTTEMTVTEDLKRTAAIEAIHQLVRTQLIPFYKALAKVTSAQEGARVIYNFLKSAGVLDQLVLWQNQALETAPSTQVMDRGIQGFNVFVQLLEQYVAILGETPFEAQTFIDLITAAFTNTSYAQIPSTLDAVNVSEMGMVQMNDRKITFMIGMNDQNLPAAVQPQVVLNDDDRMNLARLDTDFEQLQTSEQLMSNDRFLAYLAFLNPTEQLYLSYAQTNSEGKKLQVSPYIHQLQQHFELSWQVVPSQLPMTEDVMALKPWIGTTRQMIHRLVGVLRQAKDEGQPIGTPLTFIYHTLLQDPELGTLAKRVFASLDYKNQPKDLKPQVVDQLFGDTLRASVSQLETYYQNPYAYFLTYGLKLKEREIYDLTPASQGSFYHEVMDEFIKTIVREDIDLEQLTKNDLLDQVLDRVLTNVYQMPQYDILSSTGRMRFIRYRLKAVLQQSLKNNLLQSQFMAPFKPYRTEVPFGTGKVGLKGLSYPIGANHQVKIRGKIDRIDVAKVADGRLFNIIDYKSSEHDFDYQKIYQGLSLQMLTYLQSVLDNLAALGLTDARFAGAYYFHLQNPSVPLDKLKQNLTPENVAKEVSKILRYQGIFQNDATVLNHLDDRAVKIQVAKTGKLYKSSAWRAPNPKQLQILQDYNAYKIKQAATDIFAGKIPLAPVRLSNKKTVLDYSPYQSIFEFDPMLPENNYQMLKTLPAGSKDDDKLTSWLAEMQAVLDADQSKD